MGRRPPRRSRLTNVATAVHHTDTVGGEWDGPGAVAAMPNDQATLTYCHAWHEAGAGDVKGQYKFPHHRTEGGPASTTGCSAGLGRLDQADIPASERDAVRRHLQAHLDDARSEDLATPVRPPFAARGRLALNRSGRAELAPSDLEPQKFWSIKAAASTDTVDELWIYDEIGWSFWDDGITAKSFAEDLSKLKAKNLTLRINSPGGDVFDGLAIKNLLATHPAKITAKIDALAGSIASVIAQAADEIVMMPNSQMMIHDASGFAMGNSQDMLDMAALLDMISNNIAQVYADAAGGTAKDWRNIMRDEKWYTADEAVTAGLADSVETINVAKRSTQPCDGCSGADCTKCDGTGRVPTDQAAKGRAQRLAVAACWCKRLFPGHETEFVIGVENYFREQSSIDPVPPVPAASEGKALAVGIDQMRAEAIAWYEDAAFLTGTGADKPSPSSTVWDGNALDALKQGVQAGVAPPQIDLADWRSWFGEAPAQRAPEPAAPVDLGPPPARPVEDPRPALADLIKFGTAVGAANAPAERAPEPAAPVDLGPPPARPVEDSRPALADLIKFGTSIGAANAPAERAPEPTAPVDLGPPPARPVEDHRPTLTDLIKFGTAVGAANAPAERAPEVRNPMAELINSAVDLAMNNQPEPSQDHESDPKSQHATPELPFRLDVDTVKRAITESRF